MTTDIAVLERAMVVMAASMAIQTLLCLAAAVVGFIAWRRASDAMAGARVTAEAQVAELRGHLERISTTVEETARALRHGTERVDDAITDMRHAMATVRSSVGTVASVVSAPRAALAVGLWQGFQFWRKRRAAHSRPARPATGKLGSSVLQPGEPSLP